MLVIKSSIDPLKFLFPCVPLNFQTSHGKSFQLQRFGLTGRAFKLSLARHENLVAKKMGQVPENSS